MFYNKTSRMILNKQSTKVTHPNGHKFNQKFVLDGVCLILTVFQVRVGRNKRISTSSNHGGVSFDLDPDRAAQTKTKSLMRETIHIFRRFMLLTKLVLKLVMFMIDLRASSIFAAALDVL